MAAIMINDLEMSKDLDSKALENIMGGRWVIKRYRRTYYRTYRRRYTYTRTYRRRYTYTYTRRYWV
ncbi:MAG: hypothetical protein ABFS19_14810 [Thermodesulfobacteriota bacterium]